MEIVILTVVLTVAAIGGHQLYERYSRAGRAKRALRSLERVRIADAVEGRLVRIVGEVRFGDDEPLISPLSNRRCACYEIEVEESVGHGSGRKTRWRTVLRESKNMPRFMVEDETGSAVVEVSEPRIVMELDVLAGSGVDKDPPLDLASYLMTHGVDTKGLLFNKDMSYAEGTLAEGETVAVLGQCRFESAPDTEGPYREAPRRLHIVAPTASGVEMVLSDDPDTCS